MIRNTMYRDSVLGLCIDLRGPEGNVFALMGLGDDLAKQLGTLDDWRGAVQAAKLMGCEYMTIVNLFEQFFPVVTLVGKEEIHAIHQDPVEED